MSDSPRYRRLYANQWHDPALRRLNDAGRVVRLYVGAGPQTTSVGCFRLSTAVAVEDLGGTPEAFEERLEVVCAAFGWEWDPVARVVWIPDWFDWNPPASSTNTIAGRPPTVPTVRPSGFIFSSNVTGRRWTRPSSFPSQL